MKRWPTSDTRAISSERTTGSGGDAPEHARTLIVTGIFPPDIGGPATHAAELEKALRDSGRGVGVLTLRDGSVPELSESVTRLPRRWPLPCRWAAIIAFLVARRDDYDVVYTTGLQLEAVIGARLAGRPSVVKVVGDIAWERARRLGLTTEDFQTFQETTSGPWKVRAMRAARTASVRFADAVVTPSRYLARTVDAWLEEPGVAVVVPNGVRPHDGDRKASTPGLPLRALSVGRLVDHKNVDVVIEAVRSTPDVELEIIGDGPERSHLESLLSGPGIKERIRFLGSLPNAGVARRLAAAHVLVNAASYEGLPHTLLEALAAGRPIVASAAGGNTEVVRDEVNGLLVPEPTAEGFATALARLRDEPELLESLARGAAESARSWTFDACVSSLTHLLDEVVESRHRPPVAFVGKTVIGKELSVELERKLEVLGRHVRATVFAVGRAGVRRAEGVTIVTLPRLPPPLETLLYQVLAPAAAIAVETRRRNPGAIVCQSPYDGFVAIMLSKLVPRRGRPAVVVEVHGDWRAATRLYGSPYRRSLAPVADRAATWALRRADRVRTIGDFTHRLVSDAGYEGPLDTYVTFSDFAEFFATRPVSVQSTRVLFAGSLEACKAPDVLLHAWAMVQDGQPDRALSLVGSGPLRAYLARLADELGIAESITIHGRVPQRVLITLMDQASFLVLPSRSEGLGRVVIEAMARGRAVVASAVGGIPELVSHGHNGLLVPPDDPKALADAMRELLEHPEIATGLGSNGRASVENRDFAREYEDGTARLAAWTRGFVR